VNICGLFAGDQCIARPDPACLGCILGLSEIDMKAWSRFLEEHAEDMRKAGLGSEKVKTIIDAVTV
jgi:hypothetical protein